MRRWNYIANYLGVIFTAGAVLGVIGSGGLGNVPVGCWIVLGCGIVCFMCSPFLPNGE